MGRTNVDVRFGSKAEELTLSKWRPLRAGLRTNEGRSEGLELFDKALRNRNSLTIESALYCSTVVGLFMRLPAIIATALVLLSAGHASAFTIYPATNSNGSSRYVDPDDQVRSMFGLSGGDSQRLGPDIGSGRLSAAKSIITNQGVLSPDWFFSTAPRRR